MRDNIPDALIAAFERQYDSSWNDPQLRNERLAMRYGWAAAMEAKPCLNQIQEPAPVTAMDALREAEAALEVAMARILKADPGHSICVTSEAKALVAVRAALAATPATDANALGAKFFSFDPAEDVELHDTADAARAKAQSFIDLYREESADGWSEEVERVCWGVVLGQASEVKLNGSVPSSTLSAGVSGGLPPVDYVLQESAETAHHTEGVQADARDAERWRELTRNYELDDDLCLVKFEKGSTEFTVLTDGEADEVMDAAIAAAKPHEEPAA